MTIFHRFIILIFSACLLTSCNEEKVVEWPALTELDNLSIKVEQSAVNHEHGRQKQLLTEAVKTVTEVLNTVPQNAKNMEQVTVLLEDLSALKVQLVSAENYNHEQLDGLSKSIHPIVAQLMVTAGVPHVHTNEGVHDAATCTDPSHDHDGQSDDQHDH